MIDNMVSLTPHIAQPVVVSDVTLFHRVSFYAPRQFEYLFNHVRVTGPSLCEEWFSGDDVCVTIEQKLQERLQRP
jgi:hypothetical protein